LAACGALGRASGDGRGGHSPTSNSWNEASFRTDDTFIDPVTRLSGGSGEAERVSLECRDVSLVDFLLCDETGDGFPQNFWRKSYGDRRGGLSDICSRLGMYLNDHFDFLDMNPALKSISGNQ